MLHDSLPAGTSAAESWLYDARRDVHYPKPVLRGWLHLVWFEASIVLGTLLVATIAHGALELTAAAIYTAAMVGLFGVSAVYHLGHWQAATRRVLQRLDHAMIFLLIAGTATPAFLLAAPADYGLAGLAALWAITLAATVMHLVWMQAPERLVGATFLGLGWTAGMALPAVWINAGVAAAVWLLAGGLLYTVGAVCYHRRRPDPVPAVFGYHEVFHTCVCAAAACQYIAIAFFIV
jgi:hemolysin III